MKDKRRSRNCWLKTALIGLCAVAIMFGSWTGSVWAREADSEVGGTKSKHAKHGDVDQIGAKLANPVSDIWAITTSWSLPALYDGDVNLGDPKAGATMFLQPILPIPLKGSGDAEWRFGTRPVIPLVFSAPVPTGFNEFDHESGLGDIQLPTLINLPKTIAGEWLIGMGPVWILPTATDDALGEDQWAVGPAVVVGYQGKKVTAGVFPNYFWKTGSSGQDDETPDVNQGSLLYFFNYRLGDGWETGMNPTITYNHRAESGDKWTVPIGGYIGKTVFIDKKLPFNIKFGGEYSVVSPDTFGQRFQVKLFLTPVIPGLIQNPIFGE